MDHNKQESDIIKLIQNKMDISGACSVLMAAEEMGYHPISVEEQLRLANILTRTSLYMIEKKGNEVFVMKKMPVENPKPSKAKNPYKRLKYLVGLLLTILIYLIFHFVLPGLKTDVNPTVFPQTYDQLPETIEVSRDKNNYKSFSVADTLYINYKIHPEKEGAESHLQEEK